jgi:hypothetical protein
MTLEDGVSQGEEVELKAMLGFVDEVAAEDLR